MTTEKERPKFATNDTPSGRHEKLPYRNRGKLLTEGELRFYRQGLRPAVEARYFITPKVKLTDLITLPAELWKAPAGRKISQRHVDFVLCKKRDLAIVAVIELDDASHLAEKQQAKDAYLGDALLSAGIPLIRFPIYKRYDSEHIRRIIGGVLKRHSARNGTDKN